jgi:nitroreductase
MDFRTLIRRRRMVRHYSDQPVDPDAVDRILDVARRGPSAGFSQAVEFIVVTGATVRARLGTGPDGKPGFVAHAPVAVVVCTSSQIYTGRYSEPDKQRVRDGFPDDDVWLVPYWHTDAGAAMMLLLLAAVDEGLAAGVAGVMGRDGQQRIRDLLGMPESYTAVAIVAIGHEAPDAPRVTGSPRTRTRRPFGEIVHRERW